MSSTATTYTWTTPRAILSPLRFIFLLSAAGIAAGFVFDSVRVWANLLIAGHFVVGIGLAAMLFTAMHHLTGASWSTALRRVPEVLSEVVPLGAVMILATLIGGARQLYPWLRVPHEGHGFKSLWLDSNFFIARAVVYLVVWIVFTRVMRGSRRASELRNVAENGRMARWSAIWAVLFSITVWLSSVDWIMSLEPHWFSTMFGVYHFSGLFVAGLASIILVVLTLRRGPLREFVTADHLHDLGKMLFAFSTFWMYIWFSQYMLIWYSNISEEGIYFTERMKGGWMPLFVANVVVNWVVPFVVLMSRAAKRNPTILGRVAVVVLFGHWLDLYMNVMPAVQPKAPFFTPWEFAVGGLTVAAVLLLVLRSLEKTELVPVGDPLLEESLHYHA